MVKKVTALVINLDKDSERLSRISTTLAGDGRVAMVRIPGFVGMDLPKIARSTVAYNQGWASQPGEIGCFLAHVKAWEFVAATADPFCAILEDDAIPNGLGRLASSLLPDDFDFIFVNDRMSIGRRTDAPNLPVGYLPVTQSLHLLNERNGGVGGDGYVLTPIGARKLLDAVSNDLFFGHVDWRMLRYCVSPGDLEGDLADTFVANVIKNHHNPHRPPAWGVLRAYCANTPLVHFGVAGSSRLEMNAVAT